MRIVVTAALMVLVGFALPPAARAQQQATNCGSLQNAYGPYDYSNASDRANKLPVVEQFHFDAGIEQLKGHLTKAGGVPMLGGDIDYTLRAFPNHHRALWAMVRYNLEKTPLTRTPMRYTPDCYFDRAMRWRPQDPVVRMIYGMYLHKVHRNDEALTRYQEALELDPNSAETHYNLGLLLVDLERWDEAVEHAKRAYELGHGLPGLRMKLERAGHWPGETAASPQAAAAAPAQ
jgi:tetratricopeptide (TPR) repeat protein